MNDISKNYITIQGWMVQDLKLSGNALLTFGLIYGFSQDNQSEFTGSINYICKWLNCSRPTVSKSLNELIELDLIKKTEKFINNVQFNTYKINLDVVKNLCNGSKETLHGVVKKLDGGSKETLYNNNNYTNRDNIYIENQKIEINNQLQIDNEYYTLFLNKWNEYAEKFKGRKTKITSLQFMEKQNLKTINLPITELSKGMFILFKQESIIESCLIAPKHFLNEFNKYYYAGLEFEKTNKITQFYQSKNK